MQRWVEACLGRTPESPLSSGPQLVRPCLSRTTTGTRTRLTLISIGGALYCVSELRRRTMRVWATMVVVASAAFVAGAGVGGCGAAAVGPSDSKSVALFVAFGSFVSTFATDVVEGASDGSFYRWGYRPLRHRHGRSGFRDPVSVRKPERPFWSLSAPAIFGVGDNADAAACAVRIRDVEANM